jgi:hypothetical protein
MSVARVSSALAGNIPKDNRWSWTTASVSNQTKSPLIAVDMSSGLFSGVTLGKGNNVTINTVAIDYLPKSLFQHTNG